MLWTSDARYRYTVTPDVAEHDMSQGGELAVAIEIATPIAVDVMRYLRDQQLPVERLVVLSPSGGPRDNAIAGSVEACALTYGIREAARGHPRVHLFLAGPMGLSLLLGHR